MGKKIDNQRNYKRYIIKKAKCKEQTASTYATYINRYESWCTSNSINAIKAKMDDLLKFKEYLENTKFPRCKGVGLKHVTIKHYFSALKHYFRHKRRKLNPAELIVLSKNRRTLVKETYNYSNLLKFYLNYEVTSNRQARDKVILGLFIFQGVTRMPLSEMKLTDVDIENKKVRIPETINHNSRIVDLEDWQIDDFQIYLNSKRFVLLNESEKGETDKLFFSKHKTDNGLDSICTTLSRELTKRFPTFTTLTAFRESRIKIWSRDYKLREVQYLAGFKKVSTVNRYRENHIERQKEILNVHHPILTMI